MSSRVFVIDGSRVDGIASFYEELNRVFMAGEDWQLGQSLDALDDMLYGGYGALNGIERPVIDWTDAAHSRAALGREATLKHYRGKLEQPGTFNTKIIYEQIAAVESGTGPTYFEIVLAIFAEHPNITLRLG